MRRMGFRDKWIAWIRHCISSVSYAALINCSPSHFFSASRGLPISTFLFLLVMEVFTSMLRVSAAAAF